MIYVINNERFSTEKAKVNVNILAIGHTIIFQRDMECEGSGKIIKEGTYVVRGVYHIVHEIISAVIEVHLEKFN